jgi:hypothetical protein
VNYHLKDCPNDFWAATNYKTLTQGWVDKIKSHLQVTCPTAVAVILNDLLHSDSAPTATMPVAVIMESSLSSVVYMPSNTSNVIGNGSDFEESNSLMSIDITTASVTAAACLPLSKGIAPFTMLHLFWRCSMNGANDFLFVFNMLLNHGSHTVLISESFTAELCLKH